MEPSLNQSRGSLRTALFASGPLATILGLHWASEIAPSIGTLGLVVSLAGVLRRRLNAALIGLAFLGIALATAPPGLQWIRRLPGIVLLLPSYTWPLVLLPLTQAVGDEIQGISGPPGRLAGGLARLVGVASALSLLFFALGTKPASLVWPPAVAVAVLGTGFAIQRPAWLASAPWD